MEIPTKLMEEVALVEIDATTANIASMDMDTWSVKSARNEIL